MDEIKELVKKVTGILGWIFLILSLFFFVRTFMAMGADELVASTFALGLTTASAVISIALFMKSK